MSCWLLSVAGRDKQNSGLKTVSRVIAISVARKMRVDSFRGVV